MATYCDNIKANNEIIDFLKEKGYIQKDVFLEELTMRLDMNNLPTFEVVYKTVANYKDESLINETNI